jgi:hypothetical protein
MIEKAVDSFHLDLHLRRTNLWSLQFRSFDTAVAFFGWWRYPFWSVADSCLLIWLCSVILVDRHGSLVQWRQLLLEFRTALFRCFELELFVLTNYILNGHYYIFSLLKVVKLTFTRLFSVFSFEFWLFNSIYLSEKFRSDRSLSVLVLFELEKETLSGWKTIWLIFNISFRLFSFIVLRFGLERSRS